MIDFDLESIFRDYLSILIQRVEQRWSQFDEGVYTDHKANISSIVETPNGYSATLSFGGVGAWVLEFGSGSKIDYSNPWLNDYKASYRWNSLRTDDSIVGRKAGDQITTVDGSVKISSGKMAGLHLETTSRIQPYEAKEAIHIIELELEHWKTELELAIAMKVKDSLVYSVISSFKR